jgi:hypothetical protein
MNHRIVRGVCVAVALLALGCGGSEARPSRVTISAQPMPQDGNFDGVFQSPAYGRMEFTCSGPQCVGLYEGERHFGKITGMVEGNLMNFTWTQWNEDLQGKLRSKTGHGYFLYTVVEEKTAHSSRMTHKIDGEWGYDDDNAGNVWNAVKLTKVTKKTLKPHDTEETGENGESEYAESAGFNAATEPPTETSHDSTQSDAPANVEGSTNNESIDNLF